jgi:UDP-3-O-[3-hydroxymyristoyl] glucosamine N-acyltransferase
MRLAEIAERLAAPLEGPDLEIVGVASLESAGPEQLSFLSRPALLGLAQASRAGCILVPRDLVDPSKRSVIRVDDPRLAFAKVLRWLDPRPRPPAGIDPTAIVHPTARIGANVHVGPYCVIGAGSAVGDDSVLHARVTVYDGVMIGRRVIVHAGVVLGADGFGFAATESHHEKVLQVGGVDIGDDVEIGANSTVDRAALGTTRIGTGTKLDNLVHVAHNCVIGSHVVIAAQTGIAGGAIVGDWAVIGGQVGIGDQAKIGARAIIGAASAIPSGKHIPPGETVWGVPARPLHRYLKRLASLGHVEDMRRELRDLRERVGRLARSDALAAPTYGNGAARTA